MCWLRAIETVKCQPLAARGLPAPATAQPGTEQAKVLVDFPESDTADIRKSIGSSADTILYSLR